MQERVWYELENIPSGGVAYPEGWKISITPYSYGDVLAIAKAAERGTAALDKVLTGVKCNFGKEKLLPADILYIGLYRKLVSTKHTKIEFDVECPECAKKNHKIIDLKELKFKELKIPALPIHAELSTGVMDFTPIPFDKYKEVEKKYKGEPSWLVAHSVINMKPEEARPIILEAVGLDREILNKVTEYLDFGLEPIEFECCDEYCDNILKVNLEDPTVTVFPFRKSNESAEHRIKFGNEQHS